MTNTVSEIDYAAIVDDICVLNHLFAGLDPKPLLDPKRFKIIESNYVHTVIQSICCEVFYMADRHVDNMAHKFYSKFALAEPQERTVIDWVWV